MSTLFASKCILQSVEFTALLARQLVLREKWCFRDIRGVKNNTSNLRRSQLSFWKNVKKVLLKFEVNFFFSPNIILLLWYWIKYRYDEFVYSTFAVEWVTIDDEGMNNQSACQNAASERQGSPSPPWTKSMTERHSVVQPMSFSLQETKSSHFISIPLVANSLRSLTVCNLQGWAVVWRDMAETCSVHLMSGSNFVHTL
jgi:hypothetical protein